jgi:hypothetical protein
MHDTLRELAQVSTIDAAEHREHYARLAKRARYFMVAQAKMDTPDETGGQVEVGCRYFEAAAAGCVLIGDVPPCTQFTELFGWPESVVEVDPGGSDIDAVISRLRADPRRESGISRRNVVESLLRHDWIYRWIEIYRIAGVTPSAGMLSRVEQLSALAQLVSPCEHISARPLKL